MTVEPDLVACPHAVACAGCPLIHLPYPDQLASKRARVRAAFAFYGELSAVDIAPTSPAASATGYRIRAKLMVGRAVEAGVVPVGLYARSDEAVPQGNPPDRGHSAAPERTHHAIVDIPGCRVLTPLLAESANAMRQLLRAPPPEASTALTPSGGGGSLTALDLREVVHDGAHSVLVTLVLDDGAVPNDDALREAAASVTRAVPAAAGVAVNYRRRGSPQVLGATTRVVAGVAETPDDAGSAYHLATYGAFTQANRAQAQHIAHLIADHLGRDAPLGGQRVLDLYAGSGALSLPLAARGAVVTVVEAFPAAADAAARAGQRQRLRVDVRQGDAARIARELVQAGAPFDALLINPPRRGLAPEVRRAAAQLRPRTIAYVSCEPDTLARDLAHLARLGYRAMSVRPVDMMPLTDQVETVALLERAPAPDAATLFRSDDVHVRELPAYEPPTAAMPHDVLAGTAGHPGSGLVIWARSGATAAAWRTALLAARKEYVVLVRGITAPKGSLRSGSRYRRAAIVRGHSLLRVSARHDVARDLARIGHPIIGDEQHGHAPTNRHFEEKYALDRAFVHASKVVLPHPGLADTLALTPRMPGELVAVLARLGFAFSSNSRGE